MSFKLPKLHSCPDEIPHTFRLKGSGIQNPRKGHYDENLGYLSMHNN